MSTTSLLRTELTEPLAINGPGASGMVIDLLNNLESANTHLERNISSILGYFSSLAMDYTSNDAQVIADALPAKTLGQLLESTLPRLMQQNRAMQREYISGDVDVIVDFGRPIRLFTCLALSRLMALAYKVKPYLETDVFEDADGSLMRSANRLLYSRGSKLTAYSFHRIIEPLFMNALTFRRESHSYVKVSITDEMHLLPTFSGVLDKDLVNVSIRIEDNGIGMSESFLQQDYFKAMGKQVRAKPDISKVKQFSRHLLPQDEFSGGTGLSLYLAQELLHLMGGRIAVTSALGKVS
ncbi:hypothetical protein QFC19_001547 [Naganishia cerealis]|uniref:Uncharacterized protein n=1 Tax=Naganishia cerealis TaxID=610337 RepID=A0ACC2WFI6_9TREE|nr:hypothetical protein QFC19_001547 [Naganishia cerealis]